MNFAKAIRALVIALAIVPGFALPHAASAQVSIGISVGFAPPLLPVYAQPICPGEGYIWTPGYWAWDPDDEDYYWVPGTWVLAPEPGFLWTPAYWGWGGSSFVFYEGYWGPRVGFYGGIDYGYGYSGRGYEGGRWEGNRFYYNRTVNNINVTQIHNVYNTTIINNVVHSARSNRELRASENHGKPPIAATSRPGSFSGGGVVAARAGGNYNPPANRGGNSGNRGGNNPNRPPNARRAENNTSRAENNANRPNYVHPNDLPKANRSDRPPSTENPKRDQKYQQQQDKLYQKQEQDRQKLQQRQDQEHQRMTQQRANDARQQQLEQRHQQQTEQMQQKHEQQQQKMEQRQQPRQQAPPHPNEEKKPH